MFPIIIYSNIHFNAEWLTMCKLNKGSQLTIALTSHCNFMRKQSGHHCHKFEDRELSPICLKKQKKLMTAISMCHRKCRHSSCQLVMMNYIDTMYLVWLSEFF